MQLQTCPTQQQFYFRSRENRRLFFHRQNFSLSHLQNLQPVCSCDHLWRQCLQADPWHLQMCVAAKTPVADLCCKIDFSTVTRPPVTLLLQSPRLLQAQICSCKHTLCSDSFQLQLPICGSNLQLRLSICGSDLWLQLSICDSDLQLSICGSDLQLQLSICGSEL